MTVAWSPGLATVPGVRRGPEGDGLGDHTHTRARRISGSRGALLVALLKLIPLACADPYVLSFRVAGPVPGLIAVLVLIPTCRPVLVTDLLSLLFTSPFLFLRQGFGPGGIALPETVADRLTGVIDIRIAGPVAGAVPYGRDRVLLCGDLVRVRGDALVRESEGNTGNREQREHDA